MSKKLVVTTLAVLFTGLGTGTAQADHHWKKFVSMGCYAKPNPYTGGYLIAANPRWRMGTHAHKKNNLRSLKLSARLIPTTSGLNLPRNWHSTERKNVSADGANDLQLGVLTDYMSDSYDWNVEVKFQWHRRGKPDWKSTHVFTWNETFCAT